MKPANQKEYRRDRRLAKNQYGKRRVVVIVRERGDNGVPAVFKSEAQAVKFISQRVAKGTTINADEASSWDGLHSRYEMKRINHEEASTVLARIGLRNFLAVCAALRSATTIISLASICCAMRKRRRGTKITVARPMVSK